MKYAFVRDHQDRFPVELICDVLEVSRGGFYAWRQRPPGAKEIRGGELVARIGQVHRQSRATYGSPRIHRELKTQGVKCRENTVARPMKREEIRSKAVRRFRVRATDSRHDHPVAENVLNREFYPDRPDQVGTAEITYVPTAKGWPYVAVVMDPFSRKVVGWGTADHMRAELTCDAMEMALMHSRPEGKLLHHSDRGVQYASQAYRGLLRAKAIEPSMSRKGNCHDDAVTESFFSTLKRELVFHEAYADHEQARRSLFEYIEVFYNRQRLHSTLGYRSPVRYELRFAS